MIKAIIFDLDDTLYEEKTYVLDGFKKVSKYLMYKYNLEEENLYNEMIKILGEDGRGSVFDKICYKYGLEQNIEELVEIYRENKPKINLYDDAQEILKWARSNEYKIGIITDGMSKMQWNKIKSLGMESIIDEIVVSDDLGRENWKPSIKPYLKILEKLKIKPNNAIYVGDNPNKDFIGAKKIGVKTIRIIRDKGDHMKMMLNDEYEADFNIKDSLINVKEILIGGEIDV